MNKSLISCWLLAVFFVCTAAENPPVVEPGKDAEVPAVAEGSDKATPKKELSQVTVTADSMMFSMDNHTAELEGNVLVEDEKMTLTAKKMIVHLDNENKLRTIEAVEGVTLRKLASSESASGDSAYYDVKTELITLRGNCVIYKDGNTMSGQVVTYDRAKGTIQAKRASITIPIKKNDKGDKGENPLDFLK